VPRAPISDSYPLDKQGLSAFYHPTGYLTKASQYWF
jgi:hypothetical protein